MATSDAPLNVPDVTIGLARAVGGGGGGTSPEPTILYDGFESADMSAPNGPAPAKNRDGFSWYGNNRTSIVTMDPLPVEVWQNGSINRYAADSSKDWTAKNGSHSLKFLYSGTGTGATGDDAYWSENRFILGGVYPELWMSWWLRVPTNFIHAGGLQELNYKLFYVWQSGYTADPSTHGPTIGLEFRGDGNGGSMVAQTGNNLYEVQFISVPEDRGRWMQLVLHVKQNSVEGVADGIDRIWRRWEGESTYELLRDGKIRNMPTSTIAGEQGFRAGYMMGWHNGGYVEDTEWLVDDLKFSETSLLEQ